MPLLTAPSDNPKFAHTDEVAVYGLTLSPANQSGVTNVCPWSTPQCRAGCLSTAGKGKLQIVQRARQARTALWFWRPDAAYTLLVDELRKARNRHDKIAVRLNVLSDVQWEHVLPDAFWEEFADIQFFDYTKSLDRAMAQARPNYHLTFSASERTTPEQVAEIVLDYGVNVTVIVPLHPKAPKPTEWNGLPAVNGDLSDARFLDPEGHVVLLGWKGDLRKSKVGGFVKEAA